MPYTTWVMPLATRERKAKQSKAFLGVEFMCLRYNYIRASLDIALCPVPKLRLPLYIFATTTLDHIKPVPIECVSACPLNESTLAAAKWSRPSLCWPLLHIQGL